MKEVELGGQIREVSTKGTLNKSRSEGLIPAIVYGAKETSTPVWVNEKDFSRVLQTERGINVLIKLKYGSKSKIVLIKEIQRNVITDRPIHIDFHIISLKEKTEVNVPIQTVGEAPGAKTADGVLEHILREVRVSCLPTKIPESILVDISNLNIGEGITVKDLPPIEDVEILSDPESIIVHVTAPTKVEEVPVAAEAETAEPEVIGKGKKEEEGEEGAPAPEEGKEAKEGKEKAPKEKAPKPEKKPEEKK